MPKFSVKLHGEHYEIEVKKSYWLFFTRSVWNKVGFYTTRFIETDTANDAIEKVFKSVELEIKTAVRTTESSKVELYQIQEDETAYDLYAPGRGFTFYEEE